MSTRLTRPASGDRSAANCVDTPQVAQVQLPSECTAADPVPDAFRDHALAKGKAPAALAVYGLLGAGLGLVFTKSLEITTLHGEPIRLTPKEWGDSRVPGARYWMGGLVFGLGWVLLGACPGPLVALLGGGVSVMAAALVAALGGTWTYTLLGDHLPH